MLECSWIVDGCWHLDVRDLIHYLPNGASQNFAASRLRETLDEYDAFESGNGPDIVTDFLDNFLG